mmetsp:Transcript_62425/g.115903  ORF Transcript_62425/g.115903 Transcript_62425/m.115903 type:complete len:166 (+) Transcript_62425:59-556(+)
MAPKPKPKNAPAPPPEWLIKGFGRMPPSMQQRLQPVLMRVLKDMYLPALATIPAAWLLMCLPRVLTTVKMGYRSTNSSQDDSKLEKWSRHAAESFATFSVAVILCKMQKAKPMEVIPRCFQYLLARFIWTLLNFTGTAADGLLQSSVSLGSAHAIWRLLMSAISA